LIANSAPTKVLFGLFDNIKSNAVSPQTRKAVMLSIFAFPGAGHFFLKSYHRGCIFLALFIFEASIIVINIMQKAQSVADLIVARKIPIDILSINARILEQPDTFSPLVLSLATWGCIALWLLCIYDSYRLAKIAFEPNNP